jgi:light-regulated signal transduction histidine kinase (bacteriophytochrome)
MTALTVALAFGVAGGYFAIAAFVLPRIQLEGAGRRFATAFRIGGTAFFVGCGLTHAHIATHALTDGASVGVHEVVFHLLQIVGVWVFVFVGLRVIDVRVVRRKSAQELEAEALERRVSELSRSNTDLEQFAHVVSHDLKEPLHCVAGFAQLLERRYDGRLDAQADECLRFITEGCDRMATLLDGVLDYSRVAGAGLVRRRVDMEAVAREIRHSLAQAASERGAQIDIGPLPAVDGDPVQLGQLVQNLVANALKFTDGRPPHVRISAEVAGGLWRFCVQDNGIGIDPARAQRIFEMFERLDGSGRYSGTGIGLAVCKRIVERHGGTIWVQSTRGQGSTFCFTLPQGPIASASTTPQPALAGAG